jgi:hypothetical protein
MCRRLSRHGNKHDCVRVRLYILFGAGGYLVRILVEDHLYIRVFRCFPPFFQTNATAMSRLVHSRRLAYLFHFTNHPTIDSQQNRQCLKIAYKLRQKATKLLYSQAACPSHRVITTVHKGQLAHNSLEKTRRNSLGKYSKKQQ